MLFVGTKSGIYRFAQDDGAWEARGKALDDALISGITQDAGGPARMLASARHKGVFRSEDGGGSWAAVLEDVDAWSIATAPDGTLFAGVEPAGVYRSRTGGMDWEELGAIKLLPTYGSWSFPPPPHVAHVRTFVFAPDDPRTIYAGVEVGGVIGTHDGGETWQELNQGLYPDIHNMAIASEGGDVVYVATGRGFFKSEDAGVSWDLAVEGLHSIYMRPVVVHPQNPRMLFTSAATGSPPGWNRPEGAATVLYRSADSGATWEPIMEGLPSTLYGSVDAIAVDPQESNTVFAGTSEGQVLVSRDLGDSWDTLADGLPVVEVLLAA